MNYFVDPNEGFHTGAEKVLQYIRAENLRTEIRNGILFVGPRSKVHDDLRWLIKDHTPELNALVAVEDKDVVWRAGAMLRQLTGLGWPCPVPTLHALPDAEPKKEDYWSCGELLNVGEGNSYCCEACAPAKNIALSLWLQRPAASAKFA